MMYHFMQREIDKATIEDLMKTESFDVLTLDFLSVLAQTDQERYLIRQVLRSRRQQYDILRSLYMQMYHSQPQVDQNIFQKPESYIHGIKSQQVRVENRKRILSNFKSQTTDSTVSQVIQMVLNLNQYEGILLNQLERIIEDNEN
ncbi:hypothetical protein [Halalkalibacter urbisdiaboli]|uniref:hypothetical protein n=1 Tax=Halalkalibacter urbisdiaboli TaxID=1960589 RepID=UPI000B4368E9|nr:hypothetical protein [Halalkalibacter urbisdiaboli]